MMLDPKKEDYVNPALIRQLLQTAHKKLANFQHFNARATVRWFMYGIKPGEQPPDSLRNVAYGDKIKWRRIAQPIITELNGESVNIKDGGLDV